LLIDRTHKEWACVTAALAALSVGLYLALYHTTPGGLTGGDLVGMAYGILGAALMAYAGALSLLRRVPSWWWLGARQTWLRGHIWLGLLSGALALCHSAGRLGGPLESALMAVLGLTLLTGAFGLLLQQFLPRLLTVRVPSEAPYEQLPYLCSRLRQEADDLLDLVKDDPRLDQPARATLRALYRETVRPFLLARFDRSSPLARPLSAELLFAQVLRRPEMNGVPAALYQKTPGGKWERGTAGRDPVAWLQAYCEERRQFGVQERLHLWLHGWLFLHVPLALLLLVLGLAHVISVLYY
jgi:hypothetical protein